MRYWWDRQYWMAEMDGAGGGDGGGEAPGAALDVRVDGESSTEEPPAGPPPWIPERYRENPSLTMHDSLEKFIDNALEREKLIGRTIRPPADDASIEDRIAFFQKLPGMPKDASEYGVDPLGTAEGMPQRLDSDALLQTMFNNGVPPYAADAILRHLEQAENANWEATREAERAAEQAALQVLEQRWGAAFVERNLLVGLEGLRREFGGLEWLGDLVTKDAEGNERLLENSPEFAEMAYQFAKARGHDRFVPGGQGMPTSVQHARQQLDEGRVAVREGKMSEDAYNELELRLAPIAYGIPEEEENDDIRIGHVITAVDFDDETR